MHINYVLGPTECNVLTYRFRLKKIYCNVMRTQNFKENGGLPVTNHTCLRAASVVK